KGFSERNIQLMVQFQAEYPDLFSIPQRAVAELEFGRLSSPQEGAPPVPQSPTALAQRAVAQLGNLSKVRVAERVAHGGHGGHDILTADIERRFPRSLRNLFGEYGKAATRVRCFMN